MGEFAGLVITTREKLKKISCSILYTMTIHLSGDTPDCSDTRTTARAARAARATVSSTTAVSTAPDGAAEVSVANQAQRQLKVTPNNERIRSNRDVLNEDDKRLIDNLLQVLNL